MKVKNDFNKINFFLTKDLSIFKADPKLRQKSFECGLESPKRLCELCCMIIDKFDLPEQFKWSVNEVGSWIEKIGFPQYQKTFEENFIDGRKLILIDASGLAKMNIQDFEEIKRITNEIKKIYKIAPENIPSQYAETFYKFYKAFSGFKHENCKRSEFFNKFQVLEEIPIKLNHFEKLHQWLMHIPNCQKYRIGLIKREILYSVPKGSSLESTKKDDVIKSTENILKLLTAKWTDKEIQPEKRLSIFDEIQTRENICDKILPQK